MKTNKKPHHKHNSHHPDENFALHSSIYGKGEPLILLHGNGEDSSYFEHQIPVLSRMFRVHAIDSRGHGKSPRGEKPMTIRQFAADAAAYMDQHGIDQAHVLGFSDGANVAMILGMDYPERVESLVLDGGNLDLSGISLRYTLPMLAVWKASGWFSKTKKQHELLSLMVKDPAIRKEDLFRIQAPVLVIAGSKDVIKRSHTQMIADAIAQASLAIVEGDHFVGRDHPNAFNHALLRFYHSIGTNEPARSKSDFNWKTNDASLPCPPKMESDRPQAIHAAYTNTEDGSRSIHVINEDNAANTNLGEASQQPLTLEKLEGEYCVCKVPGKKALVEAISQADWCFIGVTDQEYSLVCKKEDLPEYIEACASGWKGLRLQGPLDFSLTGILAKLTGLLAEENIPVFAVSTYLTDYVLVQEENYEDALQAFQNAGYRIC